MSVMFESPSHGMRLQTAHKDHRCHICRRRIPKGVKYWNAFDADKHKVTREHTNCEEYKNEPILEKDK